VSRERKGRVLILEEKGAFGGEESLETGIKV